MFGKTKDIPETDTPTTGDIVIDDFFGDEAAVAEAVRIDNLHQRLTGVEQQINSQFTSMAAYAQIAQEQVELVRSEAQHTNERSEQRVIGLIERERSDRMDNGSGGTPNVTARLDALDTQVAEIRETIQQCLSNQKALADAITDLFAQPAAISAPAPTAATPVASPIFEEPAPSAVEVFADAAPISGTDDFAAFDDVTPIDAAPLLPVIDDVANDAPADLTAIEPHDDEFDANDFSVFAAPDIATIEPMTSLPAPVLNDDTFSPLAMPAPDDLDGPIPALSLD